MTKTNITLKIDSKLVSDSEKLYSNLGISLEAAIQIFLEQSVYENNLPFKTDHTEIENEIARREFNNPQNKTFNSIQKLMDDLNDDN
ncbi:type II toxin-antitoxin system RelB/DinJ family antitoxin [Companilactobacillus ginsenosidimutans]|uniref:Damage-inducible protein J n=1 Tax=Companilactobacillus ginsenosidimutans TaxID=1007676 RepID=A0A0H4QHW4_9LACO|nr:type II toxin-antitoxin system RelB/DinJ family antitoxin [Companilactobacillus ginsenosidimutans]AKP67989.1 hypothetical protein ABM34_10895 [Companilactobacillus ginsenosidimutans]